MNKGKTSEIIDRLGKIKVEVILENKNKEFSIKKVDLIKSAVAEKSPEVNVVK